MAQSNREFQDWFNRTLPHLVGAKAVKHFKDSFQNEGFTDEVLVKWQDVKRRTNPRKRRTRSGRTPASETQPILTNSGDLGRSIDYTPQPGMVVVKSDTKGAGSDKDYAAAHNEGTTTAGRKHNVVIPKRQFMGKSKVLDRKVMEICTAQMKRILGGK